MIVRRAVPGDAAALATLGARVFRDTFLPVPTNRPEDVESYIAATYGAEQQGREIVDPGIVTLVAAEHDELIAFAQIRRAPSEFGDVELARFYVDRTFHGRGIAQALMQECLAAARALGGETFWLGVWERNDRAQAFYRKFGFRKTGTHSFLMGSDLQTDDVLSMTL